MSAHLSCHHGHRLTLAESQWTRSSVVCPVCGALRQFSRRDDTARAGAGPTLDSAYAAQVETPEDDEGEAPTETSIASADEVRLPSGSIEDSMGSSGELSAPEVREPVPPPQFAGYQVYQELGRGGMGVVYRAREEAAGRDVALKTLQHMSPDGLHRFKQEFRTLADVAHPNLASLYELLSDGDTWCFSMELLDGVDLLEYVWSGFAAHDDPPDGFEVSCDPMAAEAVRLTPERRARFNEAIQQLVFALDALHNSGLLHQDVKPSNILMTKEGRLVVLDFGLAAEIEQNDMDSPNLVRGTPRYMAPEQAVGERLSPASDWYAVGVILYEVLTGQFPFTGRTMQVLRKKQDEVPADPRQWSPTAPPDLCDLCMALMSRDPRQRPDADEILRVVGHEPRSASPRPNRPASTARPTQLFGREGHLRKLHEIFAEVRSGSARSVFVHGESGMGKSILVRKFLHEIQEASQAVVLEGRCYEQESVPFKALDSLIDALTVHLERMPKDLIHSVMPRDRLALTRVFPVVGGVPEMTGATYPSIDNADQQELRQRAMNALRELLQRLAIREPLILYIDDLQWGDLDSVELLADLVRPPDAPRMLLLTSYRSEDVGRSACLEALTLAYERGQNLPHREELAVEALTRQEATELALALLGSGEQQRPLATKIAHESAGWPFFVWELTQHVQEDPTLADQNLELDEVIWSRVQGFPAETRRMLELVAVAGQPTPSIEIFEALDEFSRGPSLLSQLRTHNLVRTTESLFGDQSLVEPYHDRIRESVVDHLDPSVVKDHHLCLATTIQRRGDVGLDHVQTWLAKTADFAEPHDSPDLDHFRWQRVFDLAFYLDAAGDHLQALPYALLAAEQSRKQNALEVAEQQYEMALRAVSKASRQQKFRVHEGLGDVQVLRGRYPDAREHFESARKLVDDNLVLARLDWKLGVAAFKMGENQEARDHTEKALRALGERPPNAWTVLPRTLKEAVTQVLHTKFPARFVGRREADSEQARLDLFRAKVYDQLTFTYWFSSGMNFVLWSHLRQMNLAERYPPSQELGRTYSFHAVTMTGLPMAQRGINYAKRAYQIAQDSNDLWGQGRARCYHTFGCIVSAQFHEGVRTGEEAVRLLEQAGDVWEANMARMIATVPRYHLGDLRGAHQEAKKAYEIAVECRDYIGICIALLFWASSSPTTLPPGAVRRELERDRNDPLTIAGAVYAHGLELLLADNNPIEAAKALEDCLKLAKKHGVRNVCIFSAATWKATALRMAVEQAKTPAACRDLLRSADRAVRKALRITKSYLALRPQALREAGLIAAMQGAEAKARRYLNESLTLATEFDAKYDFARSKLAMAETAVQFGWSDLSQDVEQAARDVADMESH